jgi:hypothetical protein
LSYIPISSAEKVIKYYASRRSDLCFSIENHYHAHGAAVRITATTGEAYQIEIPSLNIPAELELELSILIEKSIAKLDDMVIRKTSYKHGGMYDYHSPYTLTMEEERQLAEELQRVKEGFYAKAKRDKKGNRAKPEDLEKYDKLEDYGKF